MNVKEALARRRSIRRFTDEPVSKDDLMELIEAARVSPSGCNSQPWRFRLVTDRDTIQWFGGEATAKQGWVAKAGAIIVCCVDTTEYLKDSRSTIKALRDAGLMTDEFALDVEDSYLKPVECGGPGILKGAAALNLAIAMTSMMLRAVELGLGTTWIGRLEEGMLKQKLSLPEGIGVVALLAVGHPGENPEQRPRRAIEDILI